MIKPHTAMQVAALRTAVANLNTLGFRFLIETDDGQTPPLMSDPPPKCAEQKPGRKTGYRKVYHGMYSKIKPQIEDAAVGEYRLIPYDPDYPELVWARAVCSTANKIFGAGNAATARSDKGIEFIRSR